MKNVIEEFVKTNDNAKLLKGIEEKIKEKLSENDTFKKLSKELEEYKEIASSSSKKGEENKRNNNNKMSIIDPELRRKYLEKRKSQKQQK